MLYPSLVFSTDSLSLCCLSDGTLTWCFGSSPIEAAAQNFPSEHPRPVSEQDMACSFPSSGCNSPNPNFGVWSGSIYI